MKVEDLDTLKAWLYEFKRDVITNEFKAVFFPNKIVISNSISTILNQLKEHVVIEIAWLVCDALAEDINEVLNKNNKRELADARFCISIICRDLYTDVIPLRIIQNIYKHKTHASILWALKQRDVAEVKCKLEKCYRKYPDLKTGNFEFLNIHN